MSERIKELLVLPKQATAQAPAPIDPDNRTLSVLIRCHKPERLPLLDEALFSLAVQAWPAIEPVILLQNGTEAFRQAVADLIERQPWLHCPAAQILLIEIPPGMDGRSTLLTQGLRQARGRYVAFLDDDDYVYQHGYKLLIEQLAQNECAVAVGGARTATMTFADGRWFVVTKAQPFVWGRDKADLLLDNFIPIHSYIIDRWRVSAADLYFDDAAPPLEDYEFLLRLAAKYEFDFTHLPTPVCEYRWHADNSVVHATNPLAVVSPKLLSARQKIQARKQEIHLAVPLTQWLELRQMLLRGQFIYIPQHGPRRLLHKQADRFYGWLDQAPRLATRLGRLSRAVKKLLGIPLSKDD